MTKRCEKAIPPKWWKVMTGQFENEVTFWYTSKHFLNNICSSRKRCMYRNHMNPTVEYVPAMVRRRGRTSNKWEQSHKKSLKKGLRKVMEHMSKNLDKYIEQLRNNQTISIEKSMPRQGTQEVWNMMQKWSQNGGPKLQQLIKQRKNSFLETNAKIDGKIRWTWP